MRAYAYAGLLIFLGLPLGAFPPQPPGGGDSAFPPQPPGGGDSAFPPQPPGGGDAFPPGPPKGTVQGADEKDASPNRERWERLSPEERERLREVYRRLQKLPPAERDRLLEKLRTMTAKERRQTIEEARERVRREGRPGPELGPGPPGFRIPPEVRRQLERLPPEERRVEAEKIYREAFRRWVRNLPPDLRERVKRFTPREQMEFLRAYRESGLLFRTFREEGEEEALLRLPPERLQSLLKPGAERPEGVSRSSWDRWRRLPPRGRARIIHRLEGLRGEQPTVPSAEGADQK